MSYRLLRSAGVGVALLFAATCGAAAQDGPIGFQSPSRHIACQLFTVERSNAVRCDIANATVNAKRPAECDLDWGGAFEIDGRAQSGRRICHGDTVMDAALPPLPYGSVWQRAGFTCKSETSGMTCFNADRHGFTISRGAQTLF